MTTQGTPPGPQRVADGWCEVTGTQGSAPFLRGAIASEVAPLVEALEVACEEFNALAGDTAGTAEEERFMGLSNDMLSALAHWKGDNS